MEALRLGGTVQASASAFRNLEVSLAGLSKRGLRQEQAGGLAF